MGLAVMVGSVGPTQANGRESNFFGHTSHATEAFTQAAVSEDMTFSKLGFNIVSGGSGTNNCRFRDAGGDGSQLASVAGANPAEDGSNTDTLTTGDLFNVALTDNGTDPVYAWIKCNVEFASGHGCMHFGAGNANNTVPVYDVESATRFIGINGQLSNDGTNSEVTVQIRNRAYALWDAFQVRATANARTNDSIFRNRINAGNGTGIVTFGAGVTGLLQDTAIGDAVADGDLLCASITLDTGTEDLAVSIVGGTFKCAAGVFKSECAALQQAGTARTASSTANYNPIGGTINLAAALTDAQARVKPGFNGVASNLRIYISANTLTGDATLKLMQNGSAVITTTITAAATNQWFENTVNTAAFDSDDVFSFEFDEGTSGSMTILTVAVTLAQDTAGQPTWKRFGGVPFMAGSRSSQGARTW